MAKEYADSPVAFVGVATRASASSASSIPREHKVTFPNAVDLGGLTFASYWVSATSSRAFVIDEEGEIVFDYDLAHDRPGADGKKTSAFAAGAKKHLEGARDPFAFLNVPREWKLHHEAFKYGQFERARDYALPLRRSRSSAVRGFAEGVVAAVDELEAKRLEQMEALAGEGRAGELQAEIEAYLAAFPRAKRSELRRLSAEAERNGKDEARAAADFKEALAPLEKHDPNLRAQARTRCEALAARYGSTYYGRMAQTLLANWPVN